MNRIQQTLSRRLGILMPAVLAALLFAALAGAATAQAATLTVDQGALDCGAEGEPYCTIQSALDAAVAGDTVLVADGTYAESILVSKTVTIVPADGAAPVIDASGLSTIPASRIVDIRADGVVFRGFSIVGPGSAVGISISGQDVTVEGHTITDVLTGIQLTTATSEGNNTVRDNVVQGSAHGISLQNSGNTVTGNYVSVTTEALGASAASNVISDNEFLVASGGMLAVSYLGAAVDATRNWWGTPGGPGSGTIGGTVDVDPWCTNAACTQFSDDPPPPSDGNGGASPTPVPTVVETGGVTVEVEDEQTAEVDTATGGQVETESSTGARITVDVPAGALPSSVPAGARLQVATVANLDEVADQAPPPAGAQVVTQFVVNLVGEDGDRLEADFEAPVTLEFFIPAGQVPDGATGDTLVLAFWNGEAWVEVEATVDIQPAGSALLTAQVMHFTLFSVLDTPSDFGAFSPPPVIGVTLTSWQGGDYPQLESAVGNGNSVWVTDAGRFIGYVVGAPAFVNTAFRAMFPDGVPAGTVVVVVR